MAGPFWFQRIAELGRDVGVTQNMAVRGQRQAIEWFRQKASEVKGVNVNRMMEDTKSRLFARGGGEDVGSLLCFFYDPKGKEKLPYWDNFPLSFPMSFDGDSFLDINMHYLPPTLRARLMNELYTIAVRENDKVKKLALSYEVLAGASRFAPFRPCIKRHLFSHMRSKMFYVRPEEWDTALFLPTARFVGATTEQVWRDSRRIIRES